MVNGTALLHCCEDLSLTAISVSFSVDLFLSLPLRNEEKKERDNLAKDKKMQSVNDRAADRIDRWEERRDGRME